MKNFKLLLATTAMVSMGTGNIFAADNLNSNIKVNVGANAEIVEMTSISSTNIEFPQVVKEANKYVTMSYDGSLSGDAKYMSFYDTAPGTVTIVGNIATIADNNADDEILLMPTEIPMYKGGDETKPCGKLTNITQAIPSSVSETGYVIKYGGTFTMDKDIGNLSFANGDNCQGSAQATLVWVDEGSNYGVAKY